MKWLLFISAILTITVFSFAEEPGSDWNLYGSVRLGGAYWERGHWYQYEIDSLGNPDSNTILDDNQPVERFMFDMQFNSRFGAVIKKEKLGFRFEAGWGYVLRDYKVKITGEEVQVSQRIKDALILRRLYGEWFINDYFTVLVGHEWNIANFLNSSQVFNMEQGITYCGALYTGRKPQVRFTYQHNMEPVDWKVELAVAKTDTFIISTQSDGTEEAEEILPKFEGGASIGFSSELFDAKARFVGGFTRYRQRNNRMLDTLDVVSKIKTECKAFEVALRFWKVKAIFDYAWGTNLAAYGVYMGDPEGFRLDDDSKIFYPVWGFKDTVDQQNLKYSMNSPDIKQGCVIVNIKPLPWLAVEWGGGIVIAEPTEIGLLQKENDALNAFRRSAWYANLQFTFMDDRIIIVPEYSFSDFGGGLKGQQPDGSGGKWKAWGAKIQMSM